MKTIILKKFKYQSVFGEKTFEQVSLRIPPQLNNRKIRSIDDLEGKEYNIPASELKRMERDLALDFFSKHYLSILNGERTIFVDELKGIQDILEVNRSEFGKLLGLHKGSVTNLFKGKSMKSTLSILIMERLGMELARPGSARNMLEGGKPHGKVLEASRVINGVRYAHNDAAA